MKGDQDMGEAAAVQAVRPAQKVYGVTTIRGRVESQRVVAGKRYSVLVLPAADEFARPQVVEVRGKDRIAENGEVGEVRVQIGGYRRKPYKSTNPDTGEVRTVVPVEVTLDAVED